jgi:TPR repeat protein
VPMHRSAEVKRALAGDVKAMHALCYDFTYGERGLSRNGEQARLWCAAAAERGNSSCQTLYAQLLDGGEGGPVDSKAAARWYAAAAAQGHVHALFVLGGMYAQGRGVPRDRAVADSLLGLAKQQGYDTTAAGDQEAWQARRRS